MTGLAGATMRVGGQPAFDADYEDVVSEHFHMVIGLVVGCTFIALFVGFRSLMIAIKAVLLNLLSVGGGFGALVLVFQDGWARPARPWAPLDGPRVPDHAPIVFCTVFGLSMDYEVIPRGACGRGAARRLRRTTALAEGLARTGPSSRAPPRS